MAALRRKGSFVFLKAVDFRGIQTGVFHYQLSDSYKVVDPGQFS
jgi:hypothetical protein